MKIIANDFHLLAGNTKYYGVVCQLQLQSKVFGSLHESEKPLNSYSHDATIVSVSQLATLATLTTLMNKSTWTSLPIHRYSKNSRTKSKVEAGPRPADTNEVLVTAHVRHHQLHHRQLHYYRYWENQQRMLSPRTNQLCATHKNSIQHCLIWCSHFTSLARSLNYEQMLPLQLAVPRFHDNQNLFNAQRANHTCIPKLQLNKRRVEKNTRKHINNLQFTEYSIHSTQLKS